MLTAYQLVWMSAERNPSGLAIVDDRTERAYTYKQLIAEIDVVAAGLAKRGIGAGDRVATVLPGTFDHCIVVLALQRLCAVPALINFRLTPAEISQLIVDADMKGAVVSADQEVVAAARQGVRQNGIVLVAGALAGAEPLAECRGDPMSLTCLQPDREDPAFIFYTSGTTGLPKGVLLSHRTTEHRILWLSTQAGLRHGTHNRTLGFMPLSHAIGYYGVFLVTLAMNGTYYVMSAFNPAEAVDMVERHAITYMFAVPQIYFAMTKAPNYSPAKMRSTQLVLYGGAQIDPAVLEQMDREWPAAVRHIYGTTETMCSLYNPDPVGQHIRLRPGFYSRTRIIKLNGQPADLVAPGEEGELLVDASADVTFTGYLNRPDETAEKLVDGWYYTGDVCLLHDDGDVDLIGRADDLIRSGGENIHPGEIEHVLEAHPGIKEAAVIGIADAKWGEAVTACIVCGDTSLEDVIAHVQASSLAGFKRPKNYLAVEALPRNAANKVLRRVLKSQALEARDGINGMPLVHA